MRYNQCMDIRSTTILNVPVTLSPETEILSAIESALIGQKQLFISTPNPEILVEATRNHLFLEALSLADISLPDGIGLVIALRIKGIHISKITGRSIFLRLLQIANSHKLKVYILGASIASNTATIEKIQHQYPSIDVRGSGEMSIDKYGNSNDELLHEIQTFSPNIVFVAFGHPKQELWIHRVKKLFPTTTFMAIGGTLDYFSGTVPIPPNSISSLGLEWFFRLITQPQRWKRIFTAICIFPWIFTQKELLK